MDCDTARQRMIEEPEEALVAAHLAACPACRAEAALARQIAAAVAAMPRVPAPPGFSASVMARLQPVASVIPAGVPRPALRLRPWELAWLGIASLLLVAVLKAASGMWEPALTVPLSLGVSGWAALAAGAAGVLSPLRAWAGIGSASLPTPGQIFALSTAGSIAWLGSAIGFGLGLFLLLSWRSGLGGSDVGENAHA